MSISDLEAETKLSLSPYFPDESALNNGIFYFFQGLYTSQKDTFFKDMPELLFEKTMAYFDILAPYKEGYRVYYKAHSLSEDPLSPGFWMLFTRHISTVTHHALRFMETPLSPLQNKGVQIAFLPLFMSMIPVWLDDPNPDLGKTMATLQKRIDIIEFLWR